MRPKPHRHDRGFTLLEIIVTMTITAVLATMLYAYFGEAFLQSSAALPRVMANITADANVYPKWRSGTEATPSELTYNQAAAADTNVTCAVYYNGADK